MNVWVIAGIAFGTAGLIPATIAYLVGWTHIQDRTFWRTPLVYGFWFGVTGIMGASIASVSIWALMRHYHQ